MKLVAPTTRTIQTHHAECDTNIIPLVNGVNDSVPGDADFIRPLTATETVAQMIRNGELSEKHFMVLKDRAISDELILARGYRTVGGPVGALELEKRWSKGQKAPTRFPSLMYPVHKVGNSVPHTYVSRPDNPRTSTSDTGKVRTTKYEWCRGVSPILDVLPRFKALLGDPRVDLWVSPEGTLKGDALASVGAPCVVSHNGVFGWRSKNDAGGRLILPDFEEVALQGRNVFLPYDSDMVRNGDVMAAGRRFGNWLAGKGANVFVLMLPQVGDQKVGVDDFLASLPPEQRTIETLMQYAVPLVEGTRVFTDKFGTTSDGHVLLNPAGYQNRQGPLTYTHPETGRTKVIYNGYIAVTARGHDYATGAATLTISWRDGEASDGAQVHSVMAPQVEFSTGRGVIGVLSARGAAVHERNAKELSEFLIEFARLNAKAIPHKISTAHYGYVRTGAGEDLEGVVGPGWSVGTNATYNGTSRITIKASGIDEYRAALREAATWSARPLMLALGLAVVSPFLEKLGTVRNPVMWLSGDSNWGKTSVAEFAVGLYGDKKSLSVQAGRTTWAGFTQRLQLLRGFPVLVDEAHTADQMRLQNVIYQHANGQTYARGGADGQPLGSDVLSGAVFVSGEAPPQLSFRGARNRILDIRVAKDAPLGIGPDETSDVGLMPGRERANLLKGAVHMGAGSLGESVARAIWDDWDAFVTQVVAGEHISSRSVATGHEWLRPLVAAAVGLRVLFKINGVPLELYPMSLMKWSCDTLHNSRLDNDPAQNAFETLRELVLNAGEDRNCVGAYALRQERVAHRVGNEWFVLHKSKPVTEALEQYGGLQGLGSQWTQRGWVISSNDGTSTQRRRLHGSQQRVIVISDKIMQDGTDAEVV